MTTILKRMMLAMAAFMGVMGLYAGIASASTSHSTWRGWCGGPSNTQSQFLANLDKMGATGSASKFYGVQPLNENLAGRVHSTFAVATLARNATIKNEGCSGGALFGAGSKHLSAGTKVWIDMTSLKAKFPNGFSLAPKGKGWKRMAVAVQFRAQTSCTNPGKATVVVFVWVKVKVVTTVPKTPTTPGSCNITITGGTVNGDITNCSTVTVTVICGNLSKTFTGPNSKEEAITWQQGNCNTVVTPPTPVPVPVPVPVPIPVCPSGTTGTPPNCVTPPPTPKPAPTLANLTSPQEIYTNETYKNFCVDVYSPAGDNLVVTFSFNKGTGSTVNQQATSIGKTNICGSVTAGTEPGTGRVSVVVLDTTTGLTSNTSNPLGVDVTIIQKPVNP